MKRLDTSGMEAGQLPDRTVKCVIPDLDAAYLSKLEGARFGGLKACPRDAQADATITARSDDLIALIDGRLNVGFAFLTGKVRVDAPASDLLLIRRLF